MAHPAGLGISLQGKTSNFSLQEEGERLKKELQEALQNEKQTYEMVDDLKSKFENTR